MPAARTSRVSPAQLKLVPSGPARNGTPPGRVPEGFSFRFIDLFAGIGGMRRGFEQVGGKCVFTSEWDGYAQKTYKANFGDHDVAGDIRDIDAASLPEFDVLVAGFPCQPFSIAGVSKKNALGQPHGFECETQGTLFFEVQRILAARRPAAFLLENVKNLLSHDKGRTFGVIHTVLTRELGYHVRWQVIDARHFVPQHRERIFIVGFRDSAEFEFDAVHLPDGGHTLASVLHAENGSEEAEEPFTEGPHATVAERYGLTRHLWRYLRNYAAKHKAAGNGFGYGLVRGGDVARTLSARYYKDGSEILVWRPRRAPRRLTPRECARLMGFDPLLPAVPEKRFVIPVSDTRAYKQFGNAVVVPVVKAVAEAMLPTLARDLGGRIASSAAIGALR
jgi:DNA (cytosine-5)-methyltransferase 1